MSLTEYERNNEYVDKLVYTGTPPNDPARVHPQAPYRWLRVAVENGEATITVISGLDKLANDRETTLAFDGTAIVAVDAAPTWLYAVALFAVGLLTATVFRSALR